MKNKCFKRIKDEKLRKQDSCFCLFSTNSSITAAISHHFCLIRFCLSVLLVFEEESVVHFSDTLKNLAGLQIKSAKQQKSIVASKSGMAFYGTKESKPTLGANLISLTLFRVACGAETAKEALDYSG
ncbi:hypothetical protein M9H77_35846 [Catharanthus roseus]|uniref:Uncharacterized protein n=1 Tax=Catharanthus roseus TaxID=4058 RepID=A0ACB9ZSR3_CATRO|nr:hypothetical protein M9H77_35846 [Catharanthus roseus]